MKNIVAQQKTYLAKQCIQSLIVMSGLFLASTGHAMLNVNNTIAVANDYAAVPPILKSNLDPFVMISLSVELTQQAEAYTGAASSYCNGRSGGWDVCFIPTKEYLGYYDPNKCYVYDTSGANTIRTQTALGPNTSANPHFFKPSSPVLAGGNHFCSGKWSGNFLNWATMTALDEFRGAMVGGARLVDDLNKTLLIRTHRYGDWNFVNKRISVAPSAADNTAGAVSVNPSSVTPYSGAWMTIDNHDGDNGPRFKIDTDTIAITEFNSIVQVCDPNPAVGGIEKNCTKYVDPNNPANVYYKPEGVMQKNALNMKFALTSYTGRDDNTISGGILRANAKYLGHMRPAATGGLQVNPNAEINEFGQFNFDPDALAGTQSGVINSGIINYINMFGLGSTRYKSFDPVAELFYEGLRYLKNLGPTPEYSSMIQNDAQKDNFPVITNWDDPILGQCQANNMLAIGDQFAWDDNDLPGTTVGTAPSNPDTDINVDTLTDSVGTNQGYFSGTLGSQTRGRNNNGWYVAGLAWYANTQDIRTNSQGRTDIPGVQTVKTYFVDTQEFSTSAPQREANPLWLAAKYGGFVDNDGDGVPHANGNEVQGQAEWDADNDNIPDTYVLASEPANLITGLNTIFTNINDRISSGAAAAVVANSSSGTGAIYEAVYEPKFVNGPNQISWAGQLQALFIDDQSRIREDLDGDDTLTTADPVIQTTFNAALNETTFQRFDPVTGTPTSGQLPLSNIKTIWNARDELATLLNANIPNQRLYTTTGGRYIRTWIDSDADGVVDAGEEIDFTATNFPTPGTPTSVTNGRYLGVESTSGANAAENIVNFTRGQDGITGFRSRTIDFDGTGAKVWRLSDMIHSAPTVVGRPDQLYDLLYNDLTYAQFKNQYANRRQVVFVGTNGGMLQAFNGGFYNANTSSFDLTYDFLNDSNPSNDPVSHPLGAELWAYVPMNLLPHLGWLTQTDYPHVYYVDGEPQSFDVNIFTPDATHPNGWGTILVVGMRFGGGEISVDLNSDSDGNPADNTTFRSAYIIFDITDPEQPPKLLAELTDDELGFTTGKPALVKKRVPDGAGSFVTPADNEWYLVFGSGAAGTTPATKVQALQEGISDQNARLYAYNLKTLALASLSAGDTDLDISSDPNSFVGGLTAADWNEDFVDEVIYFGTQGGSVSAPTGNLKRLVLPASFTFDPSLVTNDLVSGANQPFPSAPILARDQNGNRWIYAGTGRLWVNGDNLSMAQQSFYGAIEPDPVNFSTTLAKASMVDTTDVNVNVNGTIELISSPGTAFEFPSGTPIPTFNQLINTVASAGGWYFDLQTTTARNVSPAIRVSSSIVFSEYIPSGDVCEPEGSGFLNVVDLQTGTPAPFAAIGATGGFANKHVPLGKGVPATPVLHVSTGGPGGGIKYNVLIGRSNLNKTITNILPKPKPSGRRSWREIGL